jgi:hypothetical protein
MNRQEVEIAIHSNGIRRLSDNELGEVNGGERAPLMATLIFPWCIITVAASSGGYTTQRTNIW